MMFSKAFGLAFAAIILVLGLGFIPYADPAVTGKCTGTASGTTPCTCVHNITEENIPKAVDEQKQTSSGIWQLGVELCKKVNWTLATDGKTSIGTTIMNPDNPIGYHGIQLPEKKGFILTKVVLHKLDTDFQITVKMKPIAVEVVSPITINFAFLIQEAETNETKQEGIINLFSALAGGNTTSPAALFYSTFANGATYVAHNACGEYETYYVSSAIIKMNPEKMQELKDVTSDLTNLAASSDVVNITSPIPIRFHCQAERSLSGAEKWTMPITILLAPIIITQYCQ